MLGFGNRNRAKAVARQIDQWAREAYASEPRHEYFLNLPQTIDYESSSGQSKNEITHKLLLRDGSQIYKVQCSVFVIFEPLEDFHGAFIRCIGPSKYNAYCHSLASGPLAALLVAEFLTTYAATQ